MSLKKNVGLFFNSAQREREKAGPLLQAAVFPSLEGVVKHTSSLPLLGRRSEWGGGGGEGEGGIR